MAIIVFGFVIFFVVTKNKAKAISEDIEISDEDDSYKEDFFPDIKPVTKEQQEAKDELERVFNQMAADLEKKESEEMSIEEFEREQEENAIISYQELIKQANAKKIMTPAYEKPQKEVVKIIKDEEPKEVIKKENGANKKQLTQLELEIADFDEEPKKFKNSEIISPIFGIQGSENYEKSKASVNVVSAPRHAYDKEKNPYEENDNNDFLNSLKEFRNNL
ncbi:MAG: hypothetical protein IJ093_02515 [Bacilli bacterium]|nr:hypothetical protein [Bacilli bacterium]